MTHNIAKSEEWVWVRGMTGISPDGTRFLVDGDGGAFWDIGQGDYLSIPEDSRPDLDDPATLGAIVLRILLPLNIMIMLTSKGWDPYMRNVRIWNNASIADAMASSPPREDLSAAIIDVFDIVDGRTLPPPVTNLSLRRKKTP